MHGAPCEKLVIENDVPGQDIGYFGPKENSVNVKYKCKCPAGLHGDRCQHGKSKKKFYE